MMSENEIATVTLIEIERGAIDQDHHIIAVPVATLKPTPTPAVVAIESERGKKDTEILERTGVMIEVLGTETVDTDVAKEDEMVIAPHEGIETFSTIVEATDEATVVTDQIEVNVRHEWIAWIVKHSKVVQETLAHRRKYESRHQI